MREFFIVAGLSIGQALAFPVGTSSAHDPGQPDAAWYNSLVAKNGTPCCGGGPDGHCETIGSDDFRPSAVPGGYRARWRGEWIEVPPDSVLPRSDNPTGFPVLCVFHRTNGKPDGMCFVRPAEG